MNKRLISSCLALMCVSCNLNLSPVDYSSTTNYWKKEAHVAASMDGIHASVRKISELHTILLGELRAGTLRVGASPEGGQLLQSSVISSHLTESESGFTGTNFLEYYKVLLNINLFLQEVSRMGNLDKSRKNVYLAQAYGLRAFLYFDLYRSFGAVPLSLQPDVVNGITNLKDLALPRAKPKDVMSQIKSDIEQSLLLFNNTTIPVSLDPLGRNMSKYVWSKAASEMLKGEVYLWNSKVSVGSQEANVQDLAYAKQALLNVLSNYNLSLMPSFSDVFTKKGNQELIFASYGAENEYESSMLAKFTYSPTRSIARNYRREDGSIFGDPLQVQSRGTSHAYSYKLSLYEMYDEQDSRRDATFYPYYLLEESGNLKIAGVIVRKNIGGLNNSGIRIFSGDYIHYRLSDALLMLAEIENMQNGDPAKYINQVRQRAYANYYNAQLHAYKNSSFLTNELTILEERTKEFVQEGKRWYDLLRMKDARTGGQALVFISEADVEGLRSVLNRAEAYKIFWPLPTSVMDIDGWKQTAGYPTSYASLPEDW